MTNTSRLRIVLCSCSGSPFCAEALEHLRRTAPDVLDNIVGVVLSKARGKPAPRVGGEYRRRASQVAERVRKGMQWRINKLGFEIGMRLRAAASRLGDIEWRTPEDFCRDRSVGFRVTRDVNGTECMEWIRRKNPDLIVILTFHCILKRRIFELPSIATVNVHPSLLPKYRGAAPITQVLKEGVRETGVSLHYVDEGIDTGTIIAQRKQVIGPARTERRLRPILARAGGDLLVEYLRTLETRCLADKSRAKLLRS